MRTHNSRSSCASSCTQQAHKKYRHIVYVYATLTIMCIKYRHKIQSQRASHRLQINDKVLKPTISFIRFIDPVTAIMWVYRQYTLSTNIACWQSYSNTRLCRSAVLLCKKSETKTSGSSNTSSQRDKPKIVAVKLLQNVQPTKIA